MSHPELRRQLAVAVERHQARPSPDSPAALDRCAGNEEKAASDATPAAFVS